MSTTLPVYEHSTQPDLVQELIRQIKSDGLAAGDRLPPIRALAERFGVTGSAVRDAQIQLQTMGLIKIMPRSGAVVQPVNFEPLVGAFTNTLENALTQADPTLFHLLDARQLIEVECATAAARKRNIEDLLPLRDALGDTLNAAEPLDEASTVAARRAHYEADMRFHLAIAELGGNPVLTTMLRSLLELLKPHLVQIPWSVERKELTVNAHLELFEALRSGDAEKVGSRMTEHTGMARDSLLKKLWDTPGVA
ncbi:MAG: FadR/GntR family transcriptional regulator [Verrucomicrobiia bacterium]|jgi:GntR family transcriptional repressor for pyruvate dehydrogenase complex